MVEKIMNARALICTVVQIKINDKLTRSRPVKMK